MGLFRDSNLVKLGNINLQAFTRARADLGIFFCNVVGTTPDVAGPQLALGHSRVLPKKGKDLVGDPQEFGRSRAVATIDRTRRFN
jgi:hypothetical protein